MKTRQLQRLLRTYITPQLPGLKTKGSLLVHEPIEYLLKGFAFDSSAFDRHLIYPHYFVQPLYVPKEYIVFSFGDRLTSGLSLNEESEEAVMHRLLTEMLKIEKSVLTKVRTCIDFVRYASRVADRTDPNTREAIAYSFILSGEYSDAKKELDALQSNLRRLIRREPQIDWYAEIYDRSQRIHDALERSPQEALSILQEWRSFTANALKIS